MPGNARTATSRANPTRVRARTTRTNTGICASLGHLPALRRTDRSRAKSQRSSRNSTAMAASQGSVITAAKCRNDSPAAVNASRLVRFDTGNSSDAVFARCAVAYACGLAGTASERCRREHHGRQQHDRRIQAQDRRGRRRDDEHHRQQTLGAACTDPCHRHPGGVKQALVIAQSRQHQDCGEKADDRKQPVHLGEPPHPSG